MDEGQTTEKSVLRVCKSLDEPWKGAERQEPMLAGPERRGGLRGWVGVDKIYPEFLAGWV